MKVRLLKPVCLFTAILVLALSATAAFAQFEDTEGVMKSVMIFIFGSDIPEGWLTWNGFMQNLIFPFIALFTVMYGILIEIKIFRDTKVKIVLALIMAFVSGYAAFSLLRSFLWANAWLGTVAFGILMIWGIIMWFFGGVFENFGIFSQKYTDATGRHLLRYNKLSEEYAIVTKEIGDLNAQMIMSKGNANIIASIKPLLDKKIRRQQQLQKMLDDEDKTITEGRAGSWARAKLGY